MTTAPQITVALDADSWDWRLQAATRFGTDIAGPRLFRAPPWPEIQWQSDSQEEAARQAAILQRYLDEVYARRGPSRSKVREAGE